MTEDNHTSKSKPNKDHQTHLKDIPTPRVSRLETIDENKADTHIHILLNGKGQSAWGWKRTQPLTSCLPCLPPVYHTSSSTLILRAKGWSSCAELMLPPTLIAPVQASFSLKLLGHLRNHTLLAWGAVLSTHSNTNTTLSVSLSVSTQMWGLQRVRAEGLGICCQQSVDLGCPQSPPHQIPVMQTFKQSAMSAALLWRTHRENHLK